MEEEYTSLDLAAALLRMNMGGENQDIIDDYREARSLDKLGRYGKGNNIPYGRGSRERFGGREYGKRVGEPGGRRGKGSRSSGMATLFFNVGKEQKLKSGDILGAVAGESGIPGKLVGSIDMYDKYTFVEVPEDCADEVLESMRHVKIRGKNVKVERAGAGR